jgi:predicted nucleotidyltransferase component of viral defense system
MISTGEIRNLRSEWNLREDIIEKDYVLGWVLAGIANQPELGDTWIFKGGTALRKCYFESYRFSEDLDFTVINGGPEEPSVLIPLFQQIRHWLRDSVGIEIEIDETCFRRRENRRCRPTTQGRIGYRGPRQPPGTPKLKIDLTSDEVLVRDPDSRMPVHPFSDHLPESTSVYCYCLAELMAEKIRALSERCRPRDLYDVIHILRRPNTEVRAEDVVEILSHKCKHAGIARPTLASMMSSPYRAEIEQEWKNMLGHQLPELPPFIHFWSSLDGLFRWLDGAEHEPKIAAHTAAASISDWRPDPFMTRWRSHVPIERVRFAGANRLMIDLDYRAESGRQGWRRVEPYSLRRTDDGHLLLFVANDRGQLRSYRVDRIAGIRITDQVYRPRYLVEF